MLNVAVFDQFYYSPEHPSKTDTVRHALAPLEHDVVTYTDHLGTAVLDIVAISQEGLTVPDVVVIGGRLKGELDYMRKPETITRTESFETRKLGIGRLRTKDKQVTTTLLPVPLTEDLLGGPMALPRSYRSPVKREQVMEQAAWMERFLMAGGRTPYILSHLSRLLLPAEVRIVGISSYNSMEGLPVDAVVERRKSGDVEELREAITRPRY
jgi:hypothetical protein